MEDKKILIIIPAYNEQDNIVDTYQSIVEYNKKNKSNYDVIVINDGSTDDTQKKCIENNIPTIHLIENLGIGGAVQTGYKYAYDNNYDIAVQFDGDGQHDINYVSTIIEPIIKNKAAMVIGSRFIDKNISDFKSTSTRRIGIHLISWLIKSITGKKIYDTTSGFRACNRKVIKYFKSNYPTEYPEPITTVEILKKKLKVVELPTKMKERKNGKSSIGSWKNVYYMFNVFISILAIGLRGDK